MRQLGDAAYITLRRGEWPQRCSEGADTLGPELTISVPSPRKRRGECPEGYPL